MNTYQLGVITGILCGLLLIGLGFLYNHRKKTSPNQLDERQRLIKGKTAQHTLIFVAILLLISGLFSTLMPEKWLSLNLQNLLIAGLASLYYLTENILRGAYFGQHFDSKRLGFFKLLALVYGIISLLNLFDLLNSSGGFLHAGHLSQNAWQFLASTWTALVFGLVLFGWHLEKKHNEK